MVKSERAARTPRAPYRRRPSSRSPTTGPVTEEIAAVDAAAERAPGSWDPVPVTLPTYVSKEPAGRRTVRTIDLDSTGVWTSGHDESDSRLAREADEAARPRRRGSRGRGRASRRRLLSRLTPIRAAVSPRC